MNNVNPNETINGIFEGMMVNCYICGTPVDKRYQIGNNFYCAEHFESESLDEKAKNNLIELEVKQVSQMFQNGN